jgi:hypothetical protein
MNHLGRRLKDEALHHSHSEATLLPSTPPRSISSSIHSEEEKPIFSNRVLYWIIILLILCFLILIFQSVIIFQLWRLMK